MHVPAVHSKRASQMWLVQSSPSAASGLHVPSQGGVQSRTQPFPGAQRAVSEQVSPAWAYGRQRDGQTFEYSQYASGTHSSAPNE